MTDSDPPPPPHQPSEPASGGPVHRKHRRWLKAWLDGSTTEDEPAAARQPAVVSPAASALPDVTPLALTLVGAALALGLFADGLLRTTPWGLNVFVWIGLMLAVLAGVVHWQNIGLCGEGRWLLAPLLFFAAAFAWRDSPTLKLCNGLALLAVLSLAAVRLRAGQIRLAGLLDYGRDLFSVGLQSVAGFPRLLFGDVKWGAVAQDSGYRPWIAASRGLLLGVPLLLVFGELFSRADAVFERIVRDLFTWNLADLWGHLFFSCLAAWLVGGVLRLALLAPDPLIPVPGAEKGPRLGIIELGTVLGLLNALFLAFVVVQARYFFGGAATVEALPDLTYAEYARRGFFELVTVAALVLPLLLVAHALLDKREAAHERRFRLLAGSLVALLFLIMASAILRMRLYQEIYGQTELRLYTTAFMFWLGVVFVWLLATVLRGQARRFAFGALTTGLLAVALLDAWNPDADIVRTNAGREHAAEPLDERYVTSLSADAVPALIESLPTIDEAKRSTVAKRILARWSPPAEQDWRAWSLARAGAWQAVADHRSELEDLARLAR